jgi:hypothetical protein
MIAAGQIIEFVNEVAVVSACVEVQEELGNRHREKKQNAKIDKPPILHWSWGWGMILMHLHIFDTELAFESPCRLMAVYYGGP